MHCPYCNAALDTSGAEFRCVASGALFSRHLSAAFLERYATTTSIGDASTGVTVRTSHFFCPGCGVLMQSDACSSCHRAFDRSLLRELIELNPHVVP
jgi:hypothetical protein